MASQRWCRRRRRKPGRGSDQLPAMAAGVKRRHDDGAFCGATATPRQLKDGRPASAPSDGPHGPGRCRCVGNRSAGTGPTAVAWRPAPLHPDSSAPAGTGVPIWKCPAACRLDAGCGPVPDTGPPARVGPASSSLSAVDLVARVDDPLALGQHAIQLGVLGLQGAKAFHGGGLEDLESLAPGVLRLLRESPARRVRSCSRPGRAGRRPRAPRGRSRRGPSDSRLPERFRAPSFRPSARAACRNARPCSPVPRRRTP